MLPHMLAIDSSRQPTLGIGIRLLIFDIAGTLIRAVWYWGERWRRYTTGMFCVLRYQWRHDTDTSFELQKELEGHWAKSHFEIEFDFLQCGQNETWI